MSVDAKELDEFRKDVSAWFKENAPGDPGFLLPQSFMEVGNDEQFYFLRDWQNKVYEAGYLGMAWPAEYGGGGKDQAFQDVATREMTAQKVPFMTNTIGLNWAGPLILQMGTDEQKAKYIKGILSAEDIWCQGFSEPDHGSDLGNAQLKAEQRGNGYVLNGSKIWTSLGSYAKYMILLARTEQGTARKYDGLSFFLSPMKIKGIDPVPIKKLTGEYGFTQTYFDNAEISGECLMGNEGDGWKVAMATLMFERGAAGGQAGGHSMMTAEVSEVVELARKSMRDGKSAVDDPMVRDKLVTMIMRERTLRLNNSRGGIKGLTQERPMSLPMAGKYVATEHIRDMAEFAIELQGQNAGYYVGDEAAVDGGLWHRSYFNAFSATIGGGTSQVQQNIIGERVLGLPKS